MQPNEECLEILLIAGANPTIASENTRETALHITSSKANFASLRILLKKSTLYEDNWINFADLKGNTTLHNLISHIETQNDTSSRSSTLVSSVGSLIQLAITHGADITIRNVAGRSAFDLCSDPNSKEAFKLKRILERAHQKFAKLEKPLRKTSNNAISTTPLNNHSQMKMCEVCTENQIDVIMLPCNHMFCCTTCSLRIKKCMVCKELVDDKITIPKMCYLCEETPPTIQFTPCLHVLLCQSCSSTPKSCIKCRIPIMSKTPIFSNNEKSSNQGSSIPIISNIYSI
jgi:E3 ubiquitin-protein ligase mind-bomb